MWLVVEVESNETQFRVSPHVISYMNLLVNDWSKGYRQARMVVLCSVVEMTSEFRSMCTHLPTIFTKASFCMCALFAYLLTCVIAIPDTFVLLWSHFFVWFVKLFCAIVVTFFVWFVELFDCVIRMYPTSAQ